jgi:hypothetical protein
MASLRTRLIATTFTVCLGACTSEGDSADSTLDGAVPPGIPSGTADGGSLPSLPGLDAGSAGPALTPATPWLDAGPVAQPDASGALLDASAPDAALPEAGRPDASLTDASTAGPDGGLCAGGAPHGCYKAKAGNDPNCPAQMPEQSGFYPPMSEWKGCSSPLYQACVYLRPDGSEANCSCDFGLHWLCTY